MVIFQSLGYICLLLNFHYTSVVHSFCISTPNQVYHKKNGIIPRTYQEHKHDNLIIKSSYTLFQKSFLLPPQQQGQLILFSNSPDKDNDILLEEQQPLPILLLKDNEQNNIKVDAPLANQTGTISILERTAKYIVAIKPPSVVCHHSGWAGLRSKKKKKDQEPEIPMLQRVRDAFGDGKRVNLVHRLDRGASGCLLFTYNEEDTMDYNDDDGMMDQIDEGVVQKDKQKGSTAVLIDAMASNESNKTYIALVRGEGILYGEDLKDKGWFKVDRPIKDESGKLNNATTWFRFVAGQAASTSEDDNGDEQQKIGGGARGSLVLCRPVTGRWHQVRRHLNGLSHPILGDTSHGNSRTNREWKEQRNMPGERTCLHLARLQIPPNQAAPNGIDVCCPLPSDMIDMLSQHLPNVLHDAIPILKQEGIILTSNKTYETGTYIIPDYD